jgi:dTDP-4-amino-4,6-dideoxygalactose transaminase
VAEPKIPFNRASLVGTELANVAQAFEGGHISGDGLFTKRCHEFLERTLGVSKALLTTSCTHALEMAALLLDVGAGDEVIVPSFTFVSTVNAFVLRGARPVFIDVRPDTLNLDEARLEGLINERTRAIIPVHYAGVACEMDAISKITARHGIPVVEDNAHGLFGQYHGRALGSFGCLATLSFHETKNITCGEGGALLINDQRYIERAEILREKGTNRARFFRGQVDKYSWVDVGSSYLPSDILAAFLFSQFAAHEQIQVRRKQAWCYYFEHLRDWADDNGVRLPVVPAGVQHPHHLFHLLLPTPADRDALIAHLKERGIMAVFHYLPLHLSEMGRRFGGQPGDCPVTEDVSERLLRLPLYPGLERADLQRIVDATRAFRPVRRQQAAASARAAGQIR